MEAQKIHLASLLLGAVHAFSQHHQIQYFFITHSTITLSRGSICWNARRTNPSCSSMNRNPSCTTTLHDKMPFYYDKHPQGKWKGHGTSRLTNPPRLSFGWLTAAAAGYVGQEKGEDGCGGSLVFDPSPLFFSSLTHCYLGHVMIL